MASPAHSMTIVLNPTAGTGRPGTAFDALLSQLSTRGLKPHVVITQKPDHAIELALAATQRSTIVVAAGGDGTVHEVATGLLLSENPRARLGIIPIGTGNDTAHQLGLLNPNDALQALTGSYARTLDVIECRCTAPDWPRRHALLFAATGFAAELIRHTTPRLKRWAGRRLAYPIGFLRALLSYHPTHTLAWLDETQHQGRFLHLCAANAPWAGGGVMHLAPGARMDDGQLELCLIPMKHRFEILWNFPKLLRGTFPKHPTVHYQQGRTLDIQATPPAPVQIDGSMVGHTPASFALRPAALNVLAPASRTPPSSSRAAPNS
jgi:diacylglycerol kinase (ATP)